MAAALTRETITMQIQDWENAAINYESHSTASMRNPTSCALAYVEISREIVKTVEYRSQAMVVVLTIKTRSPAETEKSHH